MDKRFHIIEVKEVNIPERGLKFNAFKTVGKGGRKMDVRFVRDCANIPKEPCVIVVDENDCNVDTTRRFPILWVKNVKSIEEIQHKSNVDDFFDFDEPAPNPDGEPF